MICQRKHDQLYISILCKNISSLRSIPRLLHPLHTRLKQPWHPCLLELPPLLNHLRQSLGGQQNNRHSMAIKPSTDILAGFIGNFADMRMRVGRVAHNCHQSQHKSFPQHNIADTKGPKDGILTTCPNLLHVRPTILPPPKRPLHVPIIVILR